MKDALLLTYPLTDIGADGVRAIADGLRAIGAVVVGERTTELTIAVPDAATARQAETFVAEMKRTRRLITRRVVRETTTGGSYVGCSDADLAASPDIQLIGPGLTGLRGSLLQLFRFFERRFRDMASRFDAEEQHYPVMLPSAVLAEMGYFGHFPQHVTFCCHFPDSLPVLESVAGAAEGATDARALDRRFAADLAPPAHVLAPGVCLPCYAQQRGLVLNDGEVRALTMQNHVFRYEANNFRPLSRGWDFSVRDIVFFGDGADMLARRAATMEATLDLCEELELDATLELANDPFFLDASRGKAVYQRMGEVKYELLLALPGQDGRIAASSFNLHRDFYTGLYDIGLAGGRQAESACMGFGLERWLYGFVRQKGLDPARWPERVRRELR